MNSKTRFDLEQEIMGCWGVVDEIDLLIYEILEKEMSTDDASNFLLGLKTIYQAKFERLFDTFEHVISNEFSRKSSLERKEEISNIFKEWEEREKNISKKQEVEKVSLAKAGNVVHSDDINIANKVSVKTTSYDNMNVTSGYPYGDSYGADDIIVISNPSMEYYPQWEHDHTSYGINKVTTSPVPETIVSSPKDDIIKPFEEQDNPFLVRIDQIKI
jgi:hypothetical protein